MMKKYYYQQKYVNCLIQITEFLFRSPNKTDGVDLITLDLERGRDFGIPSYNKFRQLCGLKAARSFGDFIDQISKKVNKNACIFSQVYCLV